MHDQVVVKRQKWLHYKAPSRRDITLISPNFWQTKSAETERAKRIKLLQGGNDKDRALSRALAKARSGQPAEVMCCPLAARNFQIFFTARALKIAPIDPASSYAITLVDPEDAIPFNQLERIDWRRYHQKLRRRLERCLGRNVIVIGMGDVEADYDRHVWLPHYHLAVFNVTYDALETLRDRHYKCDGNSERRMKCVPLRDAGWYSYISKLIAFRKVVSVGSDGRKLTQRKRLKVPEFREYMRYLSTRQPTVHIFAMNCSVLRSASQM